MGDVTLPRSRRFGRVGQRRPEVRVERNCQPTLLRAPREIDDKLAPAVRDGHRDAGQMDEPDGGECFVGNVAAAQPARR
jgi:hypothetical protein